LIEQNENDEVRDASRFTDDVLGSKWNGRRRFVNIVSRQFQDRHVVFSNVIFPNVFNPNVVVPNVLNSNVFFPNVPIVCFDHSKEAHFIRSITQTKNNKKMLHPFLTEAGWMSNLNYFDNCFGLCSTVVLGHAQQY
jgi:hypothetical protein